jgi:hypothetical protein
LWNESPTSFAKTCLLRHAVLSAYNHLMLRA